MRGVKDVNSILNTCFLHAACKGIFALKRSFKKKEKNGQVLSKPHMRLAKYF